MLRRLDFIEATSPGSMRGLLSRRILTGDDDSWCMCLRMLSGFRNPIDWMKDSWDIVTTEGRAALTLSMGKVVRGVVRDGAGLMCC